MDTLFQYGSDCTDFPAFGIYNRLVLNAHDVPLCSIGMLLEWPIEKIRIKTGRYKKISRKHEFSMCIKSLDNARLIFEIFGTKKNIG